MNMSIKLLFYVFLCPAFAVSQADVGQASGPSYLLSTIVVTGSTRFLEIDLVRATGLKIGDQVTADNLKRAGDRLNQTGLFSQVGYRFEGKTVTYTVVDAEGLLPVSFENMIWFSDGELAKRIRESVPLFNGTVPPSGNLTEQVSAALNQILKEKQVAGHVVAESVPPGGRPSKVEFRIDGLNAKIAQIGFIGAAPERLQQLQAATMRLLGESYLQSTTPGQIRGLVTPVYGRLGFLKAQVAAAKLSILKDDPSSPSVALEVAIEEGPQFTFAGIDWSGNRAVSSEDLGKGAGVKLGAPADTSQLAKVIALGKLLYSEKGYLYTQVKATATVDSDKHTAVLHLVVDEGPVYHMGKLDIAEVNAEQAEVVRRVWEIKPGDVYDATYVKRFLVTHPKELPFLIGWNAQYTQTIHDDTQVVDLTLKFVKQ